MTEDTSSEVSDLIKCIVVSCPNYFHKDLPPSEEDHRFFPFPSDRKIAKIWTQKCGIAADHDILNAKICSQHFRPLDYTDDSQATLKPDAIPKENLGWMIGMPEVKLVKVPKFELIKEAVDENERLNDQFKEMLKELNKEKEKTVLYKKKIDNVDKEIMRLEQLIGKQPFQKGRNESLISKVFSQAQINMLLGKKKVVWSYDDMAMAFALRHVGNRECYLYLKDTLNVPLPALSAVQRWVASNKI